MSNQLDTKVKELIAIGASVAANCQPWLATHYKAAREAGAIEHEITTAIEIGEMIKSVVAANTRKFAEILVSEPHEIKVSNSGSKNPNPCWNS